MIYHAINTNTYLTSSNDSPDFSLNFLFKEQNMAHSGNLYKSINFRDKDITRDKLTMSLSQIFVMKQKLNDRKKCYGHFENDSLQIYNLTLLFHIKFNGFI